MHLSNSVMESVIALSGVLVTRIHFRSSMWRVPVILSKLKSYATTVAGSSYSQDLYLYRHELAFPEDVGR